MAKHTPARIAEIREHLSKLAARRIAVADYAREIGVAAWTIYSWRRRYGTEALAEQVAPRSARSATGVDLVEVRGVRVGSASCIEIQVGDVTVRVPPASTADDIRAVLEAVKSC
ncbi:MAG: hypothetical protein IPM29_32845 [Planctomycetes bacterium]|nr:hypothetical protein [Planctomycetota bacterium]